jgi:hypothetical protein
MDVHYGCGKFMGVILEGSKMRKGFVVMCTECQYEFKSMKLNTNNIKRPHSGTSSPFGDIFGDIFSNRGR